MTVHNLDALLEPGTITVMGITGSARCLIGGYLMETGAQCVPGGSDSWVFWTIPGGGVHGLIAYAVAVSLLFVWWWAKREMAGRGGAAAS